MSRVPTAVAALVLLALSGCTLRPDPAPPPEQPSLYTGVRLVDRLLSEEQLSELGWNAITKVADSVVDPGAPGDLRCNGDLAPALADGILRLRASATALGPVDDRGAHKQEELALTAYSDVDEAAFGRMALAIRECDGERSSTGGELWSPVTHLTEMTDGIPSHSVGFTLVTSDLDTSRREWTVIAHSADDTLLIVTTRSSDSEDSFRPELVAAAVEMFRSV